MHQDPLNSFHPVLAAWFRTRFGAPTAMQIEAWENILSGTHTLIASPTGSGKTLAALLPCLQRIVERRLGDSVKGGGEADHDSRCSVRTRDDSADQAGVKVLYITPLKALNNDIAYHAVDYLKQMNEIAAERTEEAWPGISVGVRTGDTSASTRSSMIKHPPDLLITTPESLYLLLTSAKARHMLRSVEQIIIDEIHDLAADKRGVHLSLTLERLAEWSFTPPQRIGVSATQKPLERVATFLGGWEKGSDGTARPRPVHIVENSETKSFELLVTMPEYRAAVRKEQDNIWLPLVEKIMTWMAGASTALIFVNSRRLCERLTLRLNEHAGYELAKSHHGSVSREQRLEVERMLKAGELRCLVATSSLELGIDVGHVDLVLQIDSPRQAAAGIQRIGRAGHAVGGVSRGVIIVRGRGDLAEAAVLGRRVADRDIEEIRIPRNCLDVLSQQVVAMAATDDWELSRLYELITRSDCYRDFPRDRLEAMVSILAGFYPFARPLIDWNRDCALLQRRSNTFMAAVMGAGTIPQSSAYPVYHQHSRVHLGELDEEFIHESRVGDVFQLGTAAWKIMSIRPQRIEVIECANSFSEIPFWKSEATGRSPELGSRIGAFLREMAERLEPTPAAAAPDVSRAFSKEQTRQWLAEQYALDDEAAEALISFVGAQKAVCGVPTDRTIIVETFQDELEQYHLIIHSLFGRKLNRTWQLALQRQLEKLHPQSVYSTAKDNGIEFVFSEWNDSWMHVIWQVTSDTLEALLLEAIPQSPLFAASFRRLAETSLLLSRGFNRMPAWRMRWRSEALLKEAMPYADNFPLLREALEECMNELLDAKQLKRMLHQVETGELSIVSKRGSVPSPFAVQFLADFVNQKIYEGDALSRDLQYQLLSFNKEVAAEWFGKPEWDPFILEDIRIELEGGSPSQYIERLDSPTKRAALSSRGLLVNPTADDPQTVTRENLSDERVYRLLKERGDLFEEELLRFTGMTFQSVIRNDSLSRKVDFICIRNEQRIICRDEREMYDAVEDHPLTVPFIITRFAEHRLFFTAEDIRKRYPLSEQETGEIIRSLSEQKVIEPALFAQSGDGERWSSSKVFSRIVSASIRSYQKRTEPSGVRAFCRLMQSAQLLSLEEGIQDASDRKLNLKVKGVDASEQQRLDKLRSVIERLQGMFLPASHWESLVFPARVDGYRKEDLDTLCASGEVMWIGKKTEGSNEGGIAFFLTEAKELYMPYLGAADSDRHPELLKRLKESGASFLTALCRDTDMIPSMLTDHLFDLVWEGKVSNDHFAPVRNRVKSATGGNTRSRATPFRSGLGRWYALEHSHGEPNKSAAVQTSAVAWVKHLLGCYGLISREIVAAHPLPYTWNSFAELLRKLEESGMLVRGMFVEGLRSIQFTSRDQVMQLRRLSEQGRAEVSEMMLLSSIDPANPYGTLIDWPADKQGQFARKMGNDLLFEDGQWTMWIENHGKRIYFWSTVPIHSMKLRTVLSALIRKHGLRKIVIDRWNECRIADSPVAAQLLALGAEKDRDSFVLWPSIFHLGNYE